MKKLSETTARVSRAIPKNAKTATLFGKQALRTFKCKCCLKKRLVGEAYMKDKSKRKHADDDRKICVPCFIEHNGKTFYAVKKQKEKSDSSLDDFLDT
jgi:hypothetical protein